MIDLRDLDGVTYETDGTVTLGAGGVLGPARTLVDAVKSADETGATVDALFLPGGPETLSSLGPIITHAKLDLTRTKLLGSGGWDYPNLGRDAAFIGDTCKLSRIGHQFSGRDIYLGDHF